MRILQSTVERLAWYTVMLVFVAVLIEIPAVYVVIKNQYNEEKQIAHKTLVIQNQMNCIATFFNQNNVQGGTPLKIKDLATCRLGN